MNSESHSRIGVIPARYASVRFPGKPLALLGGKPVLQHVYERARLAKRLDRLAIATDDTRIRDAAIAFGADVIMTSPDAPSGTDRIVEAVGHLECEIVVNIQGDEPFVDPHGIDECVAALEESSSVDVATLAHKIEDVADLSDPNVVKVVNDYEGNALYFSRSLIPYPRGYETSDGDLDTERAFQQLLFLKHVGLYAYRKAALMRFASLTPSPLEMIEKLEQLRILQSGSRIRIIELPGRTVSVDTPDDLAAAERMLEAAVAGGAA
jgi:3-deoxy-manno-octulosonate cytidylyltransferase (CMP-KDO synthetase)